MATITGVLIFFIAGLFLAYKGASKAVTTIGFGILLLLFTTLCTPKIVSVLLWIAFALLAIPLNIPWLRKTFLSKPLLRFYQQVMPKMSRTEQEALAAGTVAWEGELFSGNPNWKKLQKMPALTLSADEKAFLAGPVETLCGMIDNWKILHDDINLSDEVWSFLKQNGFFGLIIPKEYGGRGFSHAAHSQILAKIASIGLVPAIIVGVPNSLGPAELLLHYGTEAQKDLYLPRLARGEDLPCFALTSPVAGSDANAIEDNGLVCKGMWEGKEIVGIRLNWDKRYITLAPVATLLGLAFKLYDPDHLLGSETELGITCALIPTQTPGVIIGRRHYPLFSAFPNGPTQGVDVFVPLEWIIGGQTMAGQGWRMLMECLAAGRGISIPSMVVGGGKSMSLCTGAYSRIRRQFNVPIAAFGGVEEALARIAANTFLMDATRALTIALLEQGEKPAVASAISKYHCTELGRKVLNDAMDIHGGKAICLGPHNYLGRNYIECPVSITVEGANILTRSMIIFGQGAIRCHPFVLQEIQAATDTDARRALSQFDNAFFAHMGFILQNGARALWSALTGGRWLEAPEGVLKPYYQRLTHYSSVFAFLADMTMASMGAALKRSEQISARLGDLLSYLYMGSAVLKQMEDLQVPAALLPVVEWLFADISVQFEKQLQGLLRNLPNRLLGGFLRVWLLPWGATQKEPSDAQGARLAKLLIQPSELRRLWLEETYQNPNPNNEIVLMNQVLQACIEIEPLEKKIARALHQGEISGVRFKERVDAAVKKGIITQPEAQRLLDVDAQRRAIIAVDDFAKDEL